jgi:hypothetical protein
MTMQTPMTELEAVNFLLATIGESPVNTVENPGNIDAANARARIREISRSTQNKGWHWNTDEGFRLAPNEQGEVVLPGNTLRVYTVYPDWDLDLVVRGKRLYDRRNHTYNINRTVRVDLVRFLAFDEIPEAARWYITVTAARVFQEKTLGSEQLAKFTRDDERNAWLDILVEETETAKYNVFTDSNFAAEMIRR